MTRRLFPSLAVFLLLAIASAQTNPLPPPGLETRPIAQVTFENVKELPQAEQRRIANALHSEDPEWLTRQTPDALAAFVEGAALAVYQDNGFWRAKVSAKITWVRGRGAQRQVDAHITASSEGSQYWLKGISLAGVNAFPASELLGLMAIHPFDLANRTTLTQGMEAIRRLYVSHGYAAFTAEPKVEFDDAAHSISLLIDVQEDKPFRFGNLVLEGLDPSARRAMQRQWEQLRAQPYSQERLSYFLEKSMKSMPSGADPLDYSNTSMDLDSHTVDVFVSFLPAQADKR